MSLKCGHHEQLSKSLNYYRIKKSQAGQIFAHLISIKVSFSKTFIIFFVANSNFCNDYSKIIYAIVYSLFEIAIFLNVFLMNKKYIFAIPSFFLGM